MSGYPQAQVRLIEPTIDAILRLVPSIIDDYTVFKDALEKIRCSVAYTAPEAMSIRWYSLSNLCSTYITPEYVGLPWELELRRALAGAVETFKEVDS